MQASTLHECFVYLFYAEVVVRPLTKGVRERTNGNAVYSCSGMTVWRSGRGFCDLRVTLFASQNGRYLGTLMDRDRCRDSVEIS